MFHFNYKILDVAVRSPPTDNIFFPKLSKPQLVGEYSLSSGLDYENSDARIRYMERISAITCPISLRKTVDPHLEDDEEFCLRDLQNMFLFLGSSTERLHMLLCHDIICSRGVLELLMCSPYDYTKNWTIAVSKFRNTMYMCEVQNEELGQARFDIERLNKRIKDSLLKNLRQKCLVSMADKVVQTETDRQTKDSGQYYGVFSLEIIGIRLLFDAPLLAEYPLNQFMGAPRKFVDLQMRLDTMNRTEWAVHNRTEVLAWWVQCFLVGIENIYVAYYSNDSVVHRIKNTAVRELYEECKNDWSANSCANFLARFLGAIKKLLASVDSANLVYLFEFDARNGIIKFKVSQDRNEQTFIPDWFRDMCDEPMEHLF